MKNSAIKLAASEADKFLSALDTSPVAALASIEHLRTAFGGELPQTTRPTQSVIEWHYMEGKTSQAGKRCQLADESH